MTGAEGLCGGIAAHNKNVIRALQRIAIDRGLDLDVISLLENEQDRPEYLDSSFKFSAFSGSKLRFSFALVRSALRAKCSVFDHVALALPALPLFALRLTSAVIFAHGSEADYRMKRTSRWSYRNANCVFTNSRITCKRLLARLPNVQATVCQLGLSPDIELRESISDWISSPILLTACDGTQRAIGDQMLLLVARVDTSEGKKGHEQLVRALPTILSRFPDVQLVFPGPGDGQAVLAKIARDLGVAASVFIPGFVETAQLKALYQACFAYVMPSKQEGFGMVYLEAMNYGKACVGCRDDGAEEVIVDGETGLLINDPNHASELVAALTVLLEDSQRTSEMGRAGFQRLHEHFTAALHQSRVYVAAERYL